MPRRIYVFLRILFKGVQIVAVSEAHKRASKKWNDSRDNIMIRPDKDEGQRIRQAAAAGMSVQQYVLECCRARFTDTNDK